MSERREAVVKKEIDLRALLADKKLVPHYRVQYKQGSMSRPGMVLEVLLSPVRTTAGESTDSDFYMVRNAGGQVWTIPSHDMERDNIERFDPENFCPPANVSPYFATQQELNAHTADCSGKVWIGGVDYECAMCREQERRAALTRTHTYHDVRPVSVSFKYIIKTKLSDDEKNKVFSIGLGAITSLMGSAQPPRNWMECDGRSLSKKEYSELYAAIGDQFCPPHVEQFIPEPTLVTKLRGYLPFINKHYPRKKKMLPNPNWREGHFHIPDLRGSFPRLPPDPEPSSEENGSDAVAVEKEPLEQTTSSPYKAESASYSKTLNGYD